MPSVVKTLLGSKRFVAFLGTGLFVLLKERIPGITVTEDQTAYIVGLVAAWIVGDSIRGLPQTPITPKP